MPYLIALSLLAGALCGWRIRFPAFAIVSVVITVATFGIAVVAGTTAAESFLVAIEVMAALQVGYVLGLLSQAMMKP